MFGAQLGQVGFDSGAGIGNEPGDGSGYRTGIAPAEVAGNPPGDVVPLPEPGNNDRLDAGVVSSDDAFIAPVIAESQQDQDAAVIFDPPGGGFSEAFELRLRARLAASVVHYTLDGSLPTADSPVYEQPIPMSATTLVRARAVHDSDASDESDESVGTVDFDDSPVINQSYVRLAEDARGVDSNLPLIVVHMLGNAPPDGASHEFVSAVFAVFEPSEGRARLNQAATWTGRLGVKVRGRSSRWQTKPNYTIELRGSDTEDLKLPLLGMPSEGDWVLYAPYTRDRSLVRNAFMYEMSRRIGRYAPRTRFCELYFVANHAELQASDYAGVYVLTERLTRGDERIDVKKLNPSAVAAPAVTGGYIMKVDEPDIPAEAFFAAGRTFVYVEPAHDEITPEQSAYLREYLDSWYRSISADDGLDPLTGNAFTALMDILSFVDHHILNMLGKNPDAFELSAYYQKDRSGALAAGPIWDFDFGVGHAGDLRSYEPTQWGPMLGDALFTRTPYDALFMHPEFVEAYWLRWQQLLDSTLTAATVSEVLAGYAAELSEAEARNRARWPEMAPDSGSLEAELDLMRNWAEARLQWIRTQVGVLP